MSRRASLSSSNLSNPTALIHMLAARFQDYLYFPVPDPLYVVLGALAAAMLKGPNCWIMMVGGASAGKTTMLESLADLANDHTPEAKIDKNKHVAIIGAFDSPAALLSGVPKREIGKGASGGLLRELGPHGLIVMKDFTSMLSRDPAQIKAVKALREVFDGRYSRTLGVDGGRVLEWKGRLGFLGASTNAIDQYPELLQELGERWIYYRFPDTDGYGETLKANEETDSAHTANALRELVDSFVHAMNLHWVEGGIERRQLTKSESQRLYSIAALTCMTRTSVRRDKFTHEVLDVIERENSPRLSKSLGQLYIGLEFIGLDEPERWRLVSGMALDSIRKLRMVALKELVRANMGVVGLPRLRAVTGCGQKTVDDLVGDLRVLEVADEVTAKENRSGTGAGVRLTEKAAKLWMAGWKGIEV